MRVNGKYAGYITVADKIKPGSKNAVAMLKKQGIKNTVMLTGDKAGPAEKIAKEAGIDEIKSQLLPADKIDIVEKIKAEKSGIVVFVGDGINDRLVSLIEENKVFCGGKVYKDKLEPTVMIGVTYDDKIMQEEVFGPIMPVIEFDYIRQELDNINKLEKPLAFYYFGKDKEIIDYIKTSCYFGGGCINDAVMHVAERNLPFGGVGNSGMGSYHGRKSFETFSHYKSILKKNKIELPLKYPPYSEKKLKLVKWFFGIK